MHSDFLNEKPMNNMHEGRAGGIKWETQTMWIILFKVRFLQYILLQKFFNVCTSTLRI
jgi:hypothetical protein